MSEITSKAAEGAKVAEGDSKKVFVVHGHDEALKNDMELFLKKIGQEPIVLHRQPDQGLTVIEKFERHSDVAFVVVLLTPDDVGYTQAESKMPENKRKLESRARQNVIFEFGYFVGKLGRERVCCVYKEGVTVPTDISGLRLQHLLERFLHQLLEQHSVAADQGFDLTGLRSTLRSSGHGCTPL